jgi:hypothetical protein
MTYPFPIPVLPPHRHAPATREEEDAFYEAFAEPVPSWMMAPVRLLRSILRARRERTRTCAASRSARPRQEGRSCSRA